MYLGLARNSEFPVITNKDVFAPVLATKPEIRMMEQPNGTSVCCYLISAESTFDCPVAREARGIVFNANGKVVSRPLHKFFNVNERDSSKVENLDWSKVARIMDKRDGSMIHTVAVPNTDPAWVAATGGKYSFDLKSKKSFTSDVAHAAKALALLTQHSYDVGAGGPRLLDLCQHVVDLGATIIFEFTSPRARIVLPYQRDELSILHVRDNVTGEYMTKGALQALSDSFGVPIVKHIDNTALESEFVNGGINWLIDYAETAEGIEGWVIQFENGDMVKLKTKWYILRHRAMTFLRERDIAREVLAETIDDLKSLLVGEGVNISEILAIEQRVLNDVNEIELAIEAIYTVDRELPRKDFAIKHKGFEYFGLLMQKYSGKEPDIRGWYERQLVDDKFSLVQLNLLQTVGEPE